MSVSVLLPVYNGSATLPQAIDSILRQSHREFELLIVDDASTDNSASIISDYAQRDSRVTPVLHKQNLGLSNTLNEGLELARHDLVARMDQDDEALPQRLGAQLRFLETRPNVAVAGSWVLHMGARREFDRLVRLPAEHVEIAAILPRENCLYHPSVMFRRSAVLEAGGYRGEFKNAEDYDLWLRLLGRYELANVPQPLLRYRFSVDGMTLSRKWEQLFYIYLAQTAALNPNMPLDAAREDARRTIRQVDRRWFLLQVAAGTVRELVTLRQWRDAVIVAVRFGGEIGPRAAISLLAEISRGRMRERNIT